MATKIEALEKTIRAQEKMKANFEKKGKDKFSKKIEEKVKDLKAELKKLKDADKPKKEAKKPAKSKSNKLLIEASVKQLIPEIGIGAVVCILSKFIKILLGYTVYPDSKASSYQALSSSVFPLPTDFLNK